MRAALRERWRQEALLLAVAAMETCWIYPWLLFLTRIAGERQNQVPPVAVFASLYGVIVVARVLSALDVRLVHQQVIVIVLAIVSTHLLIRLCLFPDYAPFDPRWWSDLIGQTAHTWQRIPAALVVAFVNLLVWWRGTDLSHEYLGIDGVGFYFRWGIVALIWFFVGSVFTVTLNAAPWVFAYFFYGLLAVALARVHEVSQGHMGIRTPFNASWAVTVLVGALAVIGLGALLAGMLSVESLTALIVWLNPVIVILQAVLLVIATVLGRLLLEPLLQLLIRLFEHVFQSDALRQWFQTNPGEMPAFSPQPYQPPLFIQVLGWAVPLVILGLVVVAIALTISRHLQGQNGREVERESVWTSTDPLKDLQGAFGVLLKQMREQAAQLLRIREEEFTIESIRKIYASLTRLAANAGHPRAEAETPYEYLDRLRQALPGSEGDVALITQAYVRAHYGEQPDDELELRRVREAWFRVSSQMERESSKTH